MQESKFYVIHDCKNTRQPKWLDKEILNPDYCNNAFMDIDKYNAQTYPPSWKYCPECVAKGFKNPKTRECKKTPEQIEAFKLRMAESRKGKSAAEKMA